MTTNFRNNEVGSYNILLSVDPIFVETLKDRTNTSKAIFEEVKSSRFSTMFQSTEANFMELRHEMQIRKNKGFGSVINLKTFDPGLSFLNELFLNFTQRDLKKIVEAKRLDALKISDAFKRLKEVETKLVGLNPESTKEVIENWDSSWDENEPKTYVYAGYNVGGMANTPAWENHLRIREQLVSEHARHVEQFGELDRERSELVEFLQDFVSSKTMPKVYIAYGIGNDLNDWAGPFETYLSDIKHQSNGKVETVTYELVVDLITEQIRERVEETFDKSNLFNRSSVVIKKYNKSSAGGGLASIQFESQSKTFHDIIVKLISNYLYQLGIKNHIIMLPYLDNVLRGVIEKAVINNAHWTSGGQLESIFTDKDGIYNATTISDIAHDILAGDDAWHKYIATPATTVVPTGPRISTGKIDPAALSKLWPHAKWQYGFYDKALKEIFNAIQIKETAADTPGSDGAPMVVNDDTKLPKPIKITDPFKVNVDVTTGGTGGPGFVEGGRVMSANFGPKYSETEDIDDFSWTDPLREIVRSLNAVAIDNEIEYYGEFVSDKSLKDVLVSKFGGGTYFNYATYYSRKRSRDESLPVALDDEPLFIFGDRNLVRLLLFGEIDRLAESDPDSYTDDNYLVETGGFPIFSVTNIQDPTWCILRNDIQKMQSRDTNYFGETYKKFHKPSGYNLGYYLNKLNSQESLRLELPDEFALTDDTPENEKLLKYMYDTAFPIFMANVDNANILSHSFDVGKFLYGQLFGTIKATFSTVAKRYYTREELGVPSPIVDADTTRDEVAEKMVEVLDNIRARTVGLGSRLTPGYSVGSKVDIDAMADDLADLLLLETVGLSREVRKGKGSSVVGLLNLFLNIFSQAYEGNIRTLPMYHLSNQVHLLSQCLVMIKPIRDIRSLPIDFKDGHSITDFLSGIYRLLGFTHVISPKDAYSEFRVQKDIRAELSNAED